MKNLLLLFFLAISIVSCGGDEDSTSCDCQGIIGTRYYVNVTSDFYDECNFIDEMEYLPNGKINLYRSGSGYEDELMSEVLSYEIVDSENCKFRFFNLNESAVLEESTCSVFSLSILFAVEDTGEATVNYTQVGCGEYFIGLIAHLDYNPR